MTARIRLAAAAVAAFSATAVTAPARAAEGFELTPNGNFQLDWNRYSNDDDAFEDRHDFRRARLGLALKAGSIDAKIEYDAKPQAWTDAFVRWQLAEGQFLRAGQFKQPIGLEELTPDRVTTFMEQAAPLSLGAISRRSGVDYQLVRPMWTFTVSAFGQNFDGTNPGQGFGARGTWTPVADDTDLLHFGLAATSENPDSDAVRLRARSETSLLDTRLVDTGAFANADRLNRLGLEGAWVHGPWSVQSEYFQVEGTRDAGAEPKGTGWYVFGSWFVTGESRGYKNGAFDTPKLDDGGAWELGLRYSTVDLDDGPVLGGEQSNWTAGLTYYVSKHVRFMANYVAVDAERRGIESDPDVLEFRAQLTF